MGNLQVHRRIFRFLTHATHLPDILPPPDTRYRPLVLMLIVDLLLHHHIVALKLVIHQNPSLHRYRKIQAALCPVKTLGQLRRMAILT